MKRAAFVQRVFFVLSKIFLVLFFNFDMSY